MRPCGTCHVDIGHKRKDAQFCSRSCKEKSWHQINRATTEGRAREVERNTARYQRERKRRTSEAKAYYYANRAKQLDYSRRYRSEHPERRREHDDKRAARMRENPGYCPFGRAEWNRLVNRFRGCCAYCDKGGDLHMDHVVPLSRGGRHAIANILPACVRCNLSKSNKLLVEWNR